MTDLVFISYSNADKPVASAICATLEDAGIKCWMAPRDITPGRMWSEAIIDGINASRVMILVHSRHSNRSPQVIREVERAVNRRLLLLQVRMADIAPSRALELFIASSQWLDAFQDPADAYLESLPRLVRQLLAESVRSGEYTAEHTAEHPADQTGKKTGEPTTTARPPDTAPPDVGKSRPTGTSWPMVGAVVGVLSTLGSVGIWAFAQLTGGDRPPSVQSSVQAKPADTSAVDSTSSARPATPVSPDTVLPYVKVSATSSSYRSGERFSLRVETNAASPVQWRSGDRRIIDLTPGDSVFRASAAGSTWLFAEIATVRDSVRVSVLKSAIAGNGTSRPPVIRPALPTTKEPPVMPTRTGAIWKTLAMDIAGECIYAVSNRDTAWVRAHYGSVRTVRDEANLKTLQSVFRKRGFAASPLEKPSFSRNAVTFTMRLQYQGSFGPRLSVDVPFEVRMVDDQPQGEVETCKARDIIKAP